MADFLKANFEIIIGALGLVASFIFRNRRIKRISWVSNNRNIVQDFSSKLDELTIVYRNQPVDTLSTAKVAIWNDGTEPLKGEDIVRANPPRIVLNGDAKILHAKLLDQNNDDSQMTTELAEDGKQLTLDWYYLDKNDGMVVQIIHTGANDRDIMLAGKLIGGKLNRRPIGAPPDPLGIGVPRLLREKVSGRKFTLAFLSYLMVGVIALGYEVLYEDLSRVDSALDWILIVFFAIGFLFYIRVAQFLLRSDVPETLDFYEPMTGRRSKRTD